MRLLSKWWNQLSGYRYLFFFLWIAIILLYLPAYEAGFYRDFYGTIKHFQEATFLDFINREGLKNQSLYQGTQFLLYTLLTVLGHHPIPWFLLFTGLHVLTGSLIFKFFTAFLEWIEVQEARPWILVGIILFLISPIVAEVVVWKASFHYYIAISIIFILLNGLLTYLKTETSKHLWWMWGLYFLSSYMLELFYLTPAFVLLIVIVLKWVGKINFRLFKKAIINVFLPFSLIWVLHLMTYHFIYGKWIAHYEFDLEHAFIPANALSQLLMYFIHIISMEAFLPMNQRLAIFDFTQLKGVRIFFALSLIFTVVLGIWKYRKLKGSTQLLWLVFMMSCMSSVLVLPMWFNTLTSITNDRYYYLLSVFLFMGLSIIVLRGKRYKTIRFMIMGLYLTLNLVATFSIVLDFRNSAKIQWGLLDHFQWQEADTVLLLNLPNNYNGILLFPADTLDAFKGHLKVFGYEPMKGQIYEVSSYNMQRFWDGAHVVVKDSWQLEVTPNQYGCWWWYRTLGAHDYENELYRFTLTNEGFSYRLDFKKPLGDGTVILFQNGDQWKEVDRSKINEEQW